MGVTPVRHLHLAAFLLVALAGCEPARTRFEIESFKDTAGGERFTEFFEHGYYFERADKNLTIIFDIPPNYVEVEPVAAAEGEPAQPDGPPPASPVRMSQVLMIEVFWRAAPGSTFAESSQTNANIVYCLTSGPDSITYEGAGFVSFRKSSDDGSISGLLESAALYPARTSGSPMDLFGRCRLSGTFIAENNSPRAVALMQSLRKRVGPPIGVTAADN